MNPADPQPSELEVQPGQDTSIPKGGESLDARHCGRLKADGTSCKAWKVRGQDACAGHLGLGVAGDPVAAAEASARRRQAQAVERRRRPQDVYAEALNAHAADMSARLVKIATSPDSSDADALRAIEALNSRVLGKPKETVEQVTKPEELQRYEDLSDAELWAEWERVRLARTDGTVTTQ